jgi:hypothetical protein
LREGYFQKPRKHANQAAKQTQQIRSRKEVYSAQEVNGKEAPEGPVTALPPCNGLWRPSNTEEIQ